MTCHFAQVEQQWRLHGADSTPEWHVVHIHKDGLSWDTVDWLHDHVGMRGYTWIYPESLTLCFRHVHHATQFALTWC